MRSGVRFVEDYTDPASGIRALDEWVRGGGGLYAYLATLSAERAHGEHFLYRSSETDALGWICERTSGSPMAALLSEYLWTPMGAGHDAEIICDAQGTALHDGGFSATARDLLRFGQLLLGGGAVPGSDGHLRRRAAGVAAPGLGPADVRFAFLESPAERSFPGGWYRNQFWFRVGEYATCCSAWASTGSWSM